MTQKIKIFEMFAGYGGASFALKKAGMDFECVGFSEIDKYAIQCYNQNHTHFEKPHKVFIPFKNVNYGDAKKINPKDIPDFDLLTGGFPCQSFSAAGKGLGEQDTRGTLFNEIIRIAEIKKPRYMLLENVKGLTFKPHKKTFEKIVSEIKRIGYYVHIQVLNSKEYGIPQNRERVFFVCFKDKVDFDMFTFPKKEELKIFLKDILEDEVDEKYYLSDKQVNRIKQGRLNPKIAHTLTGGGHSGGNHSDMDAIIQVGEIKQTCIKRTSETPKEINEFLRANKGLWKISDIAMKLGLPKTQVEHYFRTDNSRAIPSPSDWKKLKELLCFRDDYDLLVTETYEKEIEFESTRRVYSSNGCSPTISSTNADKLIQVNKQPFICSQPLRFLKRNQKNLPTNYSMCVDSCNTNGVRVDKSIRRLTPKECFRLMGFLNDEINLDGLSNTQKYRLAGNGWEINLVSKIFKQMLCS